MLVHKRTMGVLDQYWTGRTRAGPDGTAEPVMAEYTLAGAGLDSGDWWEVPSGSPLGRSLRIYYPFCTPVTDEAGELIAVSPWPPWQRYGEAPPEELCPNRTPPKKRRQQRRSGLFAALLNQNKEAVNMHKTNNFHWGGVLRSLFRRLAQTRRGGAAA